MLTTLGYIEQGGSRDFCPDMPWQDTKWRVEWNIVMTSV